MVERVNTQTQYQDVLTNINNGTNNQMLGTNNFELLRQGENENRSLTVGQFLKLVKNKKGLITLIEANDYLLPSYGPDLHDLLFNFFLKTWPCRLNIPPRKILRHQAVKMILQNENAAEGRLKVREDWCANWLSQFAYSLFPQHPYWLNCSLIIQSPGYMIPPSPECNWQLVDLNQNLNIGELVVPRCLSNNPSKTINKQLYKSLSQVLSYMRLQIQRPEDFYQRQIYNRNPRRVVNNLTRVDFNDTIILDNEEEQKVNTDNQILRGCIICYDNTFVNYIQCCGSPIHKTCLSTAFQEGGRRRCPQCRSEENLYLQTRPKRKQQAFENRPRSNSEQGSNRSRRRSNNSVDI